MDFLVLCLMSVDHICSHLWKYMTCFARVLFKIRVRSAPLGPSQWSLASCKFKKWNRISSRSSPDIYLTTSPIEKKAPNHNKTVGNKNTSTNSFKPFAKYMTCFARVLFKLRVRSAPLGPSEWSLASCKLKLKQNNSLQFSDYSFNNIYHRYCQTITKHVNGFPWSLFNDRRPHLFHIR